MQMSASITSVDWWSYTLSEYVIHPFIMIILCLLSVFVVLGNLLVVSAIWHENQLHSVTNYLIASLAAADCLVGLVVMPFSVISETIIGSWTFGPTWCDLWHSFDVLASTASILNLCAISFDRYLAITDPISYPTRMTPKRIAFIVISLWTCSSLISFPAIIWWRAVGEPLQLLPPTKPPQETITNTISSSDLSSSPPEAFSGLPSQFELEAPLYKCVFTDDTYYLLFSSIISFYGPAGVMLYAYYRIYKAAVKQTRFLKHGSKQVVIGKNKKAKRNKLLSENSNFGASERSTYLDATCDGASTTDAYDRQHLVLRAHRGGCKSVSSNCNSTIANGGEHHRDPGRCPTDSQSRNDGDNSMPRPTMNGGNPKHSHDGPSEPSIAGNESCHQKNKTISNRNHLDRMSLASSRRDKLRIYRQRFDSNPIEHDDQNERTSLNRADSNPIGCRTKEADKNEEPLRVIDEQIPRSTENHETLQKLNSKPVVAALSTQSACIDVSVIHHYPAFTDVSVDCPVSKPSPVPASDGSEPGEQTNSCDISNHTDEVVKMENAGLASIADESDLDGDQCNDEMSGSGSSSGSRTSGSGETYGTGSIASVLMRPRQTQKNSFENDPNLKDCCDSNGHLSGNPRMRRTLSFGEPRTLELRRLQREQIASSDIKPGEITHPAEGTRLTKSRFHRASCGGTISTQRSVDMADVAASKASNLRSWVKFKSNNRKCVSDLQGNFIPRPPRSLIPLMMMNSDTSTDSSIAASVFKQGEESIDSGRKPAPLTSGSMVSSIQSGPRFAGRSSEVRSMVIEPHSTRNPANNVQLQRSRDDSDKRNSGNKAQMLYFDSDRLIQSLVDLTSIHYIDCVNQADGIAQKKIGQDVEAAGGQGIAVDLAKKGFDPNRSITPRQQRTVGKKKLSKLAKERKAAKTLGIVVGVFILCWLPFFVVNIIVALCGTHCIYKFEVFVAIVTWLGWLNSAMNPVIYACWSRDFRRAFKRVLCSWIEFICPYDGGNMARKLRLKKATSFPKKDAYLTRNVSSMKGTTSSTVRSGVSMNGSISRSLLSDQ